jgi:hypothetical protein
LTTWLNSICELQLSHCNPECRSDGSSGGCNDDDDDGGGGGKVERRNE